ncbi:MAG: fumarate hydratase [Ruminococcaceae bacterium]|nr:fumarate hydratase [Oscillospiraceae bacterium]
MRSVDVKIIEDKIAELFVSANQVLPKSTLCAIKCAKCSETNPLASRVLSIMEENADAARELDIPICQDTGMAVVFLEVGQDIHLVGGDLGAAIETGVRRAYVDGKLRLSVVDDPIYGRKNTGTNTPAVVHTEIVPGDRVKITVIPKGFGSENMSAVRMFNPSAVEDDIVAFVTETVKKAGANPCPPVTIGVGIGGTFEKAALLSKKALARELDDRNPDEKYAKLEEKMLNEINKLDIGPQGFGGNTTALSVKIEKYPTHIAGLPVAVNVCCHVHRHASAYV